MSSKTVHSYGTILQYYTGVSDPPPVTTISAAAAVEDVDWTAIGCLIDLNGPDQSVTETDATCLTSPMATKEYVAGLIESGSVTFNCEYNDDIQEDLHIMMQTRALKYWRLKSPDGGRDVFKAFISRLGRTIPADDRIVMPVSLKISGPVDVSSHDHDPADRP